MRLSHRSLRSASRKGTSHRPINNIRSYLGLLCAVLLLWFLVAQVCFSVFQGFHNTHNSSQQQQLRAAQSLRDAERDVVEAQLRLDRLVAAAQRNDTPQRSIVWLMSFPNSGTSYTSQMVRESTHTMTATNYGEEVAHAQPVFPHNSTAGPFWIPQEEFGPPSSRFVLVKTHCGMHCNDCSNVQYAESTYSFRRKCTLTSFQRQSQQNLSYKTYSTDRVARAIHVVRDPFDNVVSRFHHLQPPSRQRRQEFWDYCAAHDAKYRADEIRYAHFRDNPLLRRLWQVPCHAEFCKYVEWHNLATFVTQDLGLSTLVVHYESYGKDDLRQQHAVLDFLELEPLSTFPPFERHTYADYFSDEERHIVKQAFQFMASRDTWSLIERYMPAG